MKIKMKSCPFCGATDEYEQIAYQLETGYVECLECNAQITNDDAGDCEQGDCYSGIEKWNRRIDNKEPQIKKYYLEQDNSSHWYVIPVDKENEWGKWCEIPEEDEKSWEIPTFAESVGGSPSLVLFTNYELQ